MIPEVIALFGIKDTLVTIHGIETGAQKKGENKYKFWIGTNFVIGCDSIPKDGYLTCKWLICIQTMHISVNSE